MSDVKRYGLHIASQYPISGGVYIDKRVEQNGDWMKYSDYADLLTRHNALEERIRRLNVWHECDKCECLFVPGGLGAETSCATCIKRELDALREAVAWLLDAQSIVDENITCPNWRRHVGISDIVRAARAEVGRMINNGGEK